MPSIGGYQTWQTVSKSVTINAGTDNSGSYAQTGGYNPNWVHISKPGSAQAAATLATTNAASDEHLSRYPNPTANEPTLTLAADLAGRAYRLVDSVGQAVRTGQLASSSLDELNLPGGLYRLAVPAQGGQPGLAYRLTKE